MIKRRLLLRLARKARNLFPYPQAWAAISGARIPCASIYGRHAALVRPEGIALTRAGDLLAVSNSEGNSVNLYAKRIGRESTYHSKPCCMIIDSTNLNYVHDVAFSPCGTMLAAVARENHSVSVYKINKGQQNAFEATQTCCIGGVESRLGFPSGVSFHPSGEYLAIANRKNCGITLYRMRPQRDGGGINPVPFQIISEDDLLEQGLAAPHGLEFSPDGTSLVVTHKRFFKTPNSEGDSAITFFRWQTTPRVGLNPTPSRTFLRGQSCLHSVAVDTSGRFFAVTNEHGHVEVFGWPAKASTAMQIDSISIFREGRIEGAKGVAFTSDGKQVAVATVLDQVLFFMNLGVARSAH